jgi:MerR family transcriptional regulator, copper efflux regulator
VARFQGEAEFKGTGMSNGNYTIGEFSRALGVSPRTVDFYTRRGLLHPAQPSPGHGYRHYTEEDCRRVALIKQLQAKKFSLQEIRQILESSANPEIPSAVETLEQIAMDLDRLHNRVLETQTAAKNASAEAMRAVATGALQKATGLCTLLVNLLQEMPLP